MAGRIILGTANPSLDSNAEVSAGSSLTFYQNLTTTLATVYDGIGLLTPLLNPLPCDASGQFPQVWAPSLTAYSVKWSRPGLADITYDNIFVTSDVGQALNYGPEINVAAAATTDLSVSTANRQAVIGNTTITSFGTGTLLYRILRFTGTPLLTYNATSLITQTKANIQAAPGDIAIVASDESGNWRILAYTPAGNVVENTASTVSNAATQAITSIPVPAGRWRLSGILTYNGGGAGITWGQVLIGPNSASATGTVLGTSFTKFACSAADVIGGGVIPGFDVTLSAATTYYLNGSISGAGGTLIGYVRAERII